MTSFVTHFIRVRMDLAKKQVVPSSPSPTAVPPTPSPPIWPAPASHFPALPFSQHYQHLMLLEALSSFCFCLLYPGCSRQAPGGCRIVDCGSEQRAYQVLILPSPAPTWAPGSSSSGWGVCVAPTPLVALMGVKLWLASPQFLSPSQAWSGWVGAGKSSHH